MEPLQCSTIKWHWDFLKQSLLLWHTVREQCIGHQRQSRPKHDTDAVVLLWIWLTSGSMLLREKMHTLFFTGAGYMQRNLWLCEDSLPLDYDFWLKQEKKVHFIPVKLLSSIVLLLFNWDWTHWVPNQTKVLKKLFKEPFICRVFHSQMSQKSFKVRNTKHWLWQNYRVIKEHEVQRKVIGFSPTQ